MSKPECKLCKKTFNDSTLKRNNGYCGRCFKKVDTKKVQQTDSKAIIEDSFSEVVLDNEHLDIKEKYKKKPIPPKLRQEVWEKNIGDRLWGHCFTCNMRLSSFEFACGHVHSEATGGPTILENLKVVCKSCNSKMGIQNMIEFKKIRYKQNIVEEPVKYRTFQVINRKRLLFEL